MLNIAIVEDDFRIASIHENFLNEIPGVTVVGKAFNAADAVKMIEETRVDLVLVDIYLPDKLGTELIRELKTKYANLNFIVITAANNIELLQENLRLGIFYYLIKPVTMEKFTEVITNFINQEKKLNSKEIVTQEFVDQLLKSTPVELSEDSNLPKGINSLTLKKVSEIMESLGNGVTAEEVGVEMKASRTTARRYLEYFVSTGKARAELEYGIVGRPERKYYLI
ncbi:two-component system, CitB family, response regulator CitT [Planomicrobium soli]|uniref:Transcriptional regulatory protein n=1 Tax=Planomicrobium soli TaxID=1176648 RepID=A0A2P8GQM0_9BACL|nr:response regulator [Planomicrobium soli]PSL36252.1 two-component system, CitB family, response regulator CitT [Planomicrobium soli]